MKKYTLSDIKNFGYLRIAGATPEIKVADIDFNLKHHIDMIKLAEQEHIEILVFPDFSLTGITCGDLFKQRVLLQGVQKAIRKIRIELADTNLTLLLTVPEKIQGHLCKVLYVLSNQHQQAYILPVLEKSSLSNLFVTSSQICDEQLLSEEYQLLRPQSVFFFDEINYETKFSLAVYQDTSDLYAHYSEKVVSPDLNIVLSDQPELVNQQFYIENCLSSFAQTTQSVVLYLSPAYGESTTDYVYGGRGYVFEQIDCLAKTSLYESDLMIADLDLEIIQNKISTQYNFSSSCGSDKQLDSKKSARNHLIHIFYKTNTNNKNTYENTGLYSAKLPSFEFYRPFPKNPFLPQDKSFHIEYFESVLDLAAHGLSKRLEHINDPKVILGLSGGLDSTLALLIAIRAEKIRNNSNKNILCVSMPGFGTSKRTYNNTKNLADACQTEYLEIPIHDVVNQHFKDIGHDPNQQDVTYENAQARERTQILMDLANQRGGIVLGTGDMSESALGFVTYGGDHLSMYHVNGGIPKTLIGHLIKYEAKKHMTLNVNQSQEDTLARILFDVLETPVSPELLPAKNHKIAQKTEHIIGPYELHDFFLYYHIKYNFRPRKILFLTEQTFVDQYERKVILHWLKLFYKRFFANQFKRSAMADGPTISEISLSPRKGLRMPSDAVAKVWLEDLPKE